jgi:hypothetical protein
MIVSFQAVAERTVISDKLTRSWGTSIIAEAAEAWGNPISCIKTPRHRDRRQYIAGVSYRSGTRVTGDEVRSRRRLTLLRLRVRLSDYVSRNA